MFAKNLISDAERVNWIRLSRSQNVGPKIFGDLVRIYGSATNALDNISDLALKGGANKKIKISSSTEVEDEIAKVENYGAQLLLSADSDYPDLLRKIDGSPSVLTVKGDLSVLRKKCVGIVGARNASLNGCMFAKSLAHDLAKNNVVIVSGLARGIDASAHLGAGANSTIAVIAGGIDHIYPKENSELYEEISSEGLVVAELPIGAAPVAKHFPQRNRIISGLAMMTAVIEATENSGSLITAKFAKSQNRDIFAVPGSPLDPRCKGTNSLLKEGAKFLENSADIISAINDSVDLFRDKAANFDTPSYKVPDESELACHRERLQRALSYSPTSLEDIAAELKISPHILNILVLELELSGKVERLYGNKVIKILER